MGNIRLDDRLSEEFPLKSYDIVKYRKWVKLVAEAQGDVSRMERNPLPIETRHYVKIPSMASAHRMPRNFSWIIPHLLAGSSTPRNQEDISALAALGFRLVITLTKEEPLNPDWFEQHDLLKNLFIPVPNYYPPSVAQTDEALYQMVQSGGPVLVHCGGGKGRAGTLLACFLLAFGLEWPMNLCEECRLDPVPIGCCPDEDCCFRQPPAMNATGALALIRSIRPESLETDKQEAFLNEYCSVLWKRYSNHPVERIPFAGESQGVRIDGRHEASPQLLILVGLPCSGKSSFAKALLSGDESKWVRVNQDEIGGAEATERALSAESKMKGKCVILDRCNATVTARRSAMSIAFDPKCVTAVYFDAPEIVCRKRLSRRLNHETIPTGPATNVLAHFSKILQPPTRSEGFSAVYTVSSFNDADELLKMFTEAPMVGFYKFPRTTHLVNFGSASRDDLVFTEADAAGFLAVKPGNTLSLEEKIDGANLGFSIDPSTGEIRAQNRSHYVHSKYHQQFAQLNNWIYQHQADLRSVLDGGKRILFGEWMYARHSIPYTQLPDLFVAFDIYDIRTGKFLSRRRFHDILSHTSISIVPTLNAPLPKTVDDIKKLMRRSSEFELGYDIEGIYFRIDDDSTGFLKERAKVVRADFICGNDHWSKGMIQLNQIKE